jgi:hypothetical protein
MQALVFQPCIFGRNGHELESIRVGVRDVEAEDLCGLDAVIHLAAACHDPVGDRSPTARESR